MRKARRRGPSLAALPALALGLALLAGCSRGEMGSSGGLRVELSIRPDPPRVGPATVTLLVTDAAGQPVRGAKVELEGDMSHAGMAPVTAPAVETAAGRYEAEFRFTMAGDWVLTMRATLADGQRAEYSVPVPAVRSE